MSDSRRPESSPSGHRTGKSPAARAIPASDRPSTGASSPPASIEAIPANLALTGYRLREPELRFGRDNRQAVDSDAYKGLTQFGPHDGADRRAKGERTVRAVIVGREDRPEALRRAKAALTSTRLGRLHDVFEIEFVGEIRVPAVETWEEADAYRLAIQAWLVEGGPYKREIDLAFVLHDGEDAYRVKGRMNSPYFAAKAAFLKAGIPEQSLQYRNLTDRELDVFRRYRVTNILTAAYAKIGGTPWVIQDTSYSRRERPEITIGIATTAIYPSERRAITSDHRAARDGGSGNNAAAPSDGPERYVGISTIFRENGSFALWDTTAPQRDLDSYEESLERSIVSAIQLYETRENRRVERIACHVSGKRAGHRERDAIRRALAHFKGRAILADLVHITDDASFWLFDGRDPTYRPLPGYLALLAADGRQAMMHTNGRGGKGPISYPTRPLRLGIYDERPSSESMDDCLGRCLQVYQHLYELRWMSWRGVRAASKPVSIAYPQSMANLLAYLYTQEDFDVLSILPQLKNKAWFL